MSDVQPVAAESDVQRLSRILFEAREICARYGKYLERDGGAPGQLRAEHGWNPDGFGGET